ncbi:MAG: 50S ribosomal protein L11 methyltransferase [Gammaproteobacteria bacterium]|nr:MAG: 50S ribosomal protein L11 methyltransferase [Gammaproteobacteria bacterium]
MNWIQLCLTIGRAYAEDFESLLFENQALSITFQDAENQQILEPGVGETPLWDKVLIIALYEGTVDSKSIQLSLEENSIWQQVTTSRWEALEDKEWIRAWMDDYHPMKFGERLWICPSTEKPPEPDAINIFLDPGLAFGTGTHPTTALCLEWLDKNITEGQQLIDYGCGSGILAVAALKLGAKSVLAIDYDPQALIATRENAERNDIEESRLEIVSPNDAKSFEADGIIANILAETLRDLVDSLASQVKKGGWLTLSGILVHQAESLIDLYSQWFNMNEPVILGEWVLLSGIKK